MAAWREGVSPCFRHQAREERAGSASAAGRLFAFGSEEGDEVGDVLGGELIAEGGHGLASVVDLGGDGGGLEAAADVLEVWAFATADAGGAVAVGAAGGGEEFGTVVGGGGLGQEGGGGE